MIKLKKTEATEWLGNGFGSQPASWVVDGAEHIAIRYLGNWVAIDTRLEGFDRLIARGATKMDLLEVLEVKQPEVKQPDDFKD